MMGGPARKPGDTLRHSSGYVLEYAPDHPHAHNGYVYQHRLVWEAAHGPVPLGWHIHHKNHVKDDNRLENLEVLTVAEHRAHHPETPEQMRERIRNATEARHRNGNARRGCTRCNNPKHYARGLCSRCYHRQRRSSGFTDPV